MYTALIAFALVTLIVSFLCSMWEAVLLSISPSYTHIKLNEGGRVGLLLEEFKLNIDRPLAAILTMNTFAHTIGAVGVGQQAAMIWTNSNPFMTGVVVPLGMTMAILLLSEIVPKTIAASNWRALAPFTVRSLALLILILSPIVWLCQIITKAFSQEGEKSVFSRSDFLALAEIGSQEGHLDTTESKFIQNLLNFKTFVAKDVMTPRTVAVTASEDMTLREFYDIQEELVFSRVPIWQDGEKDIITGYVLKDHVLEELVEGEEDKPLKSLKRDIIVVEEDYGILDLFNDFIQKREQIALVVDKFGGMSGIITMEDIVETLLGAEIVDETDDEVDMQALARKNWRNRYRKTEIKRRASTMASLTLPLTGHEAQAVIDQVAIEDEMSLDLQDQHDDEQFPDEENDTQSARPDQSEDQEEKLALIALQNESKSSSL